MAKEPGWQQPARTSAPKKPSCPHFGLIFAAFQLQLHAVGHEWVCTCGKVFIVVSDGPDGPKKFEAR